MSTISIGRISTAPDTEIRVAVDHAKGVVDLRQFDLIGQTAGVFTPSRIGLLVPLDRLSSLIATLQMAQAQAINTATIDAVRRAEGSGHEPYRP